MKASIFFKYILGIALCCFILFPIDLFSQLDEEYETTLLLEEEDETDVFNTVFKPIIGIGEGMFTFLGDVKSNKPFTPINGYYGTKAVISRTLGKSFEFDLFFIFGHLGGAQNGYTTETTPNPEAPN